MVPTLGSLIGGKYRVLRLIGEGGMGSVYEARHETLGSRVALKFLHPDLAERPQLVARFLQEARVSASIRSPHVTRVMDVDQTPDGSAYFVMELLEGESLEQRLERSGKLPLEEALDIAMQILSALEAAHGQGVVHRDLKPDNVWLTPTGDRPLVKLLDFGIAKLRTASEFQSIHTRPGSMMGTPAYMAPEQAISADQVDHRADIYSFGVMLYEMLSGDRPVEGEDANTILEKLVRGEVRPLATRAPELPEDLCALIDSMASANPDDRPESATAVKAELSRYARNSFSGLQAPPGSRAPASRQSEPVVPDTVPPDEPGIPPYATRAQAVVVVPATRTSAMPAPPTASFVNASTLDAGRSVPPPKKRHGLAWTLAIVLLLAIAGGALWALENPSFFGDDRRPPYPILAPTPDAPKVPGPLDSEVAGDPRTRRRIPPRGADTTPSRGGEAPSRGGQAPAPGGQTLPLPQFPFPFPIPSGILPIPSTLPPFMPPMAAPVTSPQTAPAPSASSTP